VFADTVPRRQVKHIADAAGCCGPFYQYFASKEDVFWRLAGHLSRELAGLADRLDPVAPDADGSRRGSVARRGRGRARLPTRLLSFPAAFGTPAPRSRC
jgi:AcrR family transcriptional regulator